MNSGAMGTSVGVAPARRLPSGFARKCIEWAFLAGSVAYLGGTVLAVAAFVAFIVGVVLPSASLFASSRLLRGLDAELRFAIGLLLTVMLATPWFYVRRALGLPTWLTDAALMAALVGAAWGTGAWPRLRGELDDSFFAAARPYVLVLLPAAFCATWCGYAARVGGEVLFYRAFPNDFGNLTSVVTAVKVSPGLPQASVAGAGCLVYHWYFFALPAWLSTFLGAGMPNGNALVLANLAVASVAFGVYALAARHCLDTAVSWARACAAAGIVVFAPFSLYAYQIAVGLLRLPWFSVGARNHFVMSQLTGLTAFGNNTTALCLLLLLLLLLREWNNTGLRVLPVLGCLFLCLTMGYSATLFFPAALAIAVWVLAGRIRDIGSVVLLVLPTGLFCALVLLWTNVLGSDARRPVPAFDGGQYVRNVLLSMFPIWVFVALSWRRAAGAGVFGVLIGACLVVPSVLRVEGSSTGDWDFGMKVAALISASALPLVAAGIGRVFDSTWRLGKRLVAGAAIALGIAHGLAYLGQFAVYRLGLVGGKALALPADYWDALCHVRRNAPLPAVVLDGAFLDKGAVNVTVLGTERRVFLASRKDLAIHACAARSPEIAARRRAWDEWQASGLADPRLSRQLAMEADVLILPAGAPPGDAWSSGHRSGGWVVFTSRLRNEDRSADSPPGQPLL